VIFGSIIIHLVVGVILEVFVDPPVTLVPPVPLEKGEGLDNKVYRELWVK
jgi:hypothetical protein